MSVEATKGNSKGVQEGSANTRRDTADEGRRG
jgi:hypothetical protein